MNKIFCGITFLVLLTACSKHHNEFSIDAGSLPQCTPLGGASGKYCKTTDDGQCMTTVCECTDSLGRRIPTITTPMTGYDGGCDAGQ